MGMIRIYSIDESPKFVCAICNIDLFPQNAISNMCVRTTSMIECYGVKCEKTINIHSIATKNIGYMAANMYDSDSVFETNETEKVYDLECINCYLKLGHKHKELMLINKKAIKLK